MLRKYQKELIDQIRELLQKCSKCNIEKGNKLNYDLIENYKIENLLPEGFNYET